MSVPATLAVFDRTICTMIKGGDVKTLHQMYQHSKFELVPYYLLCACMYGRLEVVMWLLKHDCPLEDEIYMPQVHSMFACHYGHFDCFIYLKISLVPLAPASLLFSHCINTYHTFGLGHIEVLNYLIKMYDLVKIPSLKQLVVRDVNMKQLLELVQPQDIHLLFWLNERLLDVSHVLHSQECKDKLMEAFENECVY